VNAEHTILYNRIEAFAFDEPEALLPFITRLAAENGWTREHAQRVALEYKKFAFLAVVAGHAVTPSDAVDQAWHLHLTYTRSYWEDFCPNVLGRSFHHQPTRGGAAESDRFLRDYAATLESYERFFGERPPADIWPDPARRFSRETRFQRMNTANSCVVPRWSLEFLLAGVGFLFGIALLVAVGLMLSTPGVGAKAAALPPPLNLGGPAFLVFFVAAFAVVALLAGSIRACFRQPTDDPRKTPELDAYETAYLAGAEDAVLYAAMAALVSRGTLITSKLGLERGGNGETVGLHAAERSVLEALHPDVPTSLEKLRTRFLLPSALPHRLQALGLTVSDKLALPGWILPLAIFLPVPVLGCIQLLIGIARKEPVGFLAISCLFAVGVAAVFGERLHRTVRGDRALARLRDEQRPLESGKDGGGQSLLGTDLALAVALFGVAILATSPWIGLHTLLTPLVDARGYGGVCGDGDSGGDGGCGGCGGCG